ncbi:MFS transporter [Meridianimarinicoccus roseus]|uniref:MFS transporter n=1 Tax=Meridianimarinicoccus roseus TaxID=2072018 RepID=A0A2V2LGV7_9RHOB|nr:methyltransferase [Meridianimarinicoccus roseus]PWR01619.1 MFS transporter [Meridianimarinicoccus roseus]
MSEARLDAALSQGLIPAPGDARTLVIGADADSALAQSFPDARFVQPLQPDHDRLAAMGRAVEPDISDGPDAPTFDLAIVAVPRARARAEDWAARAAARLAPGGVLVLDGAKTDGIDSLWRALRGRLDGAETLTKAHGRVICGRIGADRLADLARPAAALPDGFVTGPGVFSADGPDPGSAALAAALPARLPARIADLGAGWGWLSAQILARPGVASLDMVEADHIALEAARRNVADPRVRLHWADATGWRAETPLDAVVMNPPFHTGRAGDPGLGQAFIAAAAASLAPQGHLWLVANRHLPYEGALETLFRDWQDLGGGAAFKILHASRPIQTRKGARR